jgi:Fe-S-cluster containining protein
MHCSNCGICCRETEMLLSQNDVARLLRRGYKANYFVDYDNLGYARLKNRRGFCVFYDVKKHRCKVYSSRPSGCRVYPVILDEQKVIILDKICQSRNTITEKEKQQKGEKVIKLIKEIDSEAQKRCF